MDGNVKQIPPVPIKTYQWEDVRRAKRRGKYPFTYLFKGPYKNSADMEEEKENKPADSEKKVKKVRKVKKVKSTDSSNGEKPKEDDKKGVLMEVEQLITDETEITEIKLKDEPEIISEVVEEIKMETEEILQEKTEDKTVEITVEEQKENQETKPEVVKEEIDKISTDKTESDDTYTESNIEQYLDKDVSKSVSDTSFPEATTSVLDVDLTVDSKQSDKKRKHSNLSEVTKSNLSLFDKLKANKFKPPTFKIPKFKKFGFTKKNSKRVKTEPSVQTIVKVEIETGRRKSESPVYIYIPLNPSPEDLEVERQAQQKLESSRREHQATSESNGNHFVEPVDTNGSSTLSSTTDIKSVSSKWKSFQSKSPKKSPPTKKKSSKKTSPKPENKSSLPLVQKRSDSPVEYIHIPLTGPLPPELLQRAERTEIVEPETEEPKVKKESPKGAIRKKPIGKDKKGKDTEHKLAKDIKKLASKLKGIQKKNKKALGSKKSSTKSPTKEETNVKESLPFSRTRGDSPVEYIHIPLTGPLPENLLTSVLPKDDKEEIQSSEKIKDVEESKMIDEPTQEIIESFKDIEESNTTEAVEKKENIEEETKPDTVVIKKKRVLTKEESLEKKEDTKVKKTLKKKESDKAIEKEKEEETKSEQLALESTAVNSEEKDNTVIESEKKENIEVSDILEIEATTSSTEPKKELEDEDLKLNEDSQEDPNKDIEIKEKEGPKKSASSVHALESILRMAGSSASLEDQKYVKIEPKEKESLMKRIKSIKKPEKKLPSIKKKDIKTLEKSTQPKTPKKERTEVVYPGVRHKDSVVEYIHIPLNPSEAELEEESKRQEQMEVDVEQKITDSKKKEEDQKVLETETKKEKILEKKEEPLKKEKVFSKLKGLTQKTEKKPEPKAKKEVEAPEKDLESKKHEESPPVEYIHIPLKPTESEKTVSEVKEDNIETEEVSTEQTESVKPTSETECKKPEILETTDKEEKIQEISSKEKDFSKLKELTHKTEKKSETSKISKEIEEPKKEITEKKHGDSPPVEYTFIPLKGSSPEISQAVEKSEETEESKERVPSTEESVSMDTDIPQTKDKEKVEKSKEPAKKSLMSKLKGVKQEPEKKPTTKKIEDKPVVKKGDSPPVEYIFIPLNPSEEELVAEKQKEEELKERNKKITEPKETLVKNISEPIEITKKVTEAKLKETIPKDKKEKASPSVIKQTVATKWRGLKVGLKVDKKSPPSKKKPAKKVSPKSEQKSERSMSPKAIRRQESIVEYIHIPLNPTEEELAAEKEHEKEYEKEHEKEHKKDHEKEHEKEHKKEHEKKYEKEHEKKTEESKKVTPVIETPKTVKEVKDTSKGAIKKQSQEKSTSKLTDDIKKFALKLKEMQKKTKKPTFKTFKRGSKKVSPTVTKKPISPPPRIQPRREDSPVEYIFIPLNPTPEQLKQEQEREKLRQLAKKPTEEEIKKEKEKQRLRRLKTTTTTATTTVTKIQKPKLKPEKHKKKAEPKKDVASSSTYNTLKKTKELSKAKLKALKDTIQQSKDKLAEKKTVKVEEKKPEITETVTKKGRESPDYIFIPLKAPENETLKEEELQEEELQEEELKQEKINDKEEEEKIPIEPEETEEKLEEKTELEIIKKTSIQGSETHLYEPISKEDEEDGLKTAILKKETKLPAEEPLKSLLKATDSPKLHKKVSFKRKSASVDKENGLNLTQNFDDDNIIYETIQIGGPETEKPEKPTRKKETKPKSAEEQKKSTDRDEDKEKWSQLTDHEYEPINPPSEPSEAVAFKAITPALVSREPSEAPPPVHVTQLTDLTDYDTHAPPPISEPAPLDSLELRQLRIPLDDELIVPPVESSETPEPDRTSSPDTQATYLGTPTTTLSSRTDGISTSQVDSAALEHLPLKKEGRKKKLAEMEETQTPKIQDKLRTQAGKLKTKIKSIKKPTFTIPNPKFSPKFKRPKFHKPKFQRPKFDTPKFSMPSLPSMPSMPKMPERPKINFPSFSLPRPGSIRRHRSPEERHISTTESSAESKKNIFDFRTYPRLFDRSKKKTETAVQEPAFATVPRAAARKKGPVGARWVHRFTDIHFADDETKPATNSDELRSKDRGDSLERRMEADLRYEQALAEDEDMREFERENIEISRHSPYATESIEFAERWQHGSFHHQEEEDLQQNRDERSSVTSSGHQRGVLEEIDSDQFFLREKGISQDNLQVGLYLSSEIRDAFRQPVNSLSQMEREYELDASDISISRPNRPKRKHLKKTKRMKKTPHASEENINFDEESINTEPEEYKTFPLPKPRHNKRSKFLAKEESLEAPSEETERTSDLQAEISSESLPNIIGYIDKHIDVTDEYDKYLMYENEMMKNIEQPEIIIHADQKYEIEAKDIDKYLEESGMVKTPKPPTRRQRSLKSLNLSEHDSILGEFNRDKMMQDVLEHELNIYRVEHEYIVPEDEEKPIAPLRTRSRSRTESQADDDRTSHGAESLITESEEVHEPPCRQELRDAMGYAIIDKSQKYREPPLPSTPRRRRSTKSNRSDRSPIDTKFFTVPRALNDTPPTRPSRNYSTLGPNRPPRKKSELDLTAEEKENIDISQYIEIEDDDHSRDLHSGEVINKMKTRPLPAPPRPPRKSRDRSKEALRDITLQSNIISDTINEHEKALDISPASPMEPVEEIEVSTQTDPLPDDFCCEEFVQEPTDRIVAPTRRKKSIQSLSRSKMSLESESRSKTPVDRDSSFSKTIERPITPLESYAERASSPHAMIIEQRIRTPVEDEIITHASLLVRPVPEYPPDSFVSKRFGADIPDILPENILSSPVVPHSEPEEPEQTTLSSDTTLLPESIPEVPPEPLPVEEPIEVTPDIPEKPQRRKSQAQIIERIIERQVPVCVTPGPDTEVEILKAQRLQVAELDVEKLNVSELQASKILVSEIDGVSLQISELTSKSGNLVVNGLEIPSGLIQEILDRLQPTQPPEQPSSSKEQVATQTSLEEPESQELSREQIATQTSFELPEEQIEIKSTEQVATQTSVEEPEPNIEPIKFIELKTLPIIHADHAGESIVGVEFIRAHSPSPTIVIDPPEPSTEEPEPEQDEEQDVIANIRERIRFIEEEMNEFISDFTPDEMHEIKSEIESIIDIASERVRQSTENISEEPELIVDEAEEEVIDQSDPEELFIRYSPEDILDVLPELETDIIFLPQSTATLTEIIDDSKSEELKQKSEISDDSIIPKEFHELKSEQAEIIDNIQKERNNIELQPEIESKVESSQTTPTPPRPPLPNQEHVLHEIHYPLSYYPEFSIPPPGFYTMQSPQTQDLSDEEIPVHHRRRRHHRHLSRSRSSSDDERRTVSRRHATRSPEPSITQLSGQLARACSNSFSRQIRQLFHQIRSHFGTREGKHDLQIAILILLVLIAGLILLGYGSGKTIHLHHWEYFNPPKEM